MLKVRLEVQGERTLLYPQGRLDFGAAAGLQNDIDAALTGGGAPPRALLIDCSGLEYISSAGLRVLLQSARSAQRGRIFLALCSMQPSVRDVFELSGFNRLIPVFADQASAERGQG
jgi:anti-anti-sigma factor